MVQKNGKSGLNNGATMKFGETNYLMKKQGMKTGFFIRKLFNVDGNSAGRIRRYSDREVSSELDNLREVEGTGGLGLPQEQDSNPIYVSLNKHSRWDLLERLKDHLQLKKLFEEKMQSINSPVLGITLVEKYGDYLHGHLSTKDYCNYLSYESNMAPKELPVSNKSNGAYLWDLQHKFEKRNENDDLPETKRSIHHNKHFRGVQRRPSAEKKSLPNELKERKIKSQRHNSLAALDDAPEVLYEVTYPRPLDASSGCQDLKVRRWNWCFREKKSRSKCKGQKISRRANYYCLSQKELKNLQLYGDVDDEEALHRNIPWVPQPSAWQLRVDSLLSDPNDRQCFRLQTERPEAGETTYEPNPYEEVDADLFLSSVAENMLGKSPKEEKFCHLDQEADCETGNTHDSTETQEADQCLTYRDPMFPWGTPFELSMIHVDADALMEDEFEFIDPAEGDVKLGEFEVVEDRCKEENTVDGVLLVEKEDGGFIRVDSRDPDKIPRQTVTLGDFIKRKNASSKAKSAKSKKSSKKRS